MKKSVTYPTPQHKEAAQAIVEFYRDTVGIEAVLLVNSCARGKASQHSCLDIAILLKPDTLKDNEDSLEKDWQKFYEAGEIFKSLRKAGKYSEVHLDFINGIFVLTEREEVGPPDTFEIEIGNRVAHSVSLWEGGEYFSRLKERWLPYYDDKLRKERLGTVIDYCHNNLDHIPLYVERGLYFQAFERLRYAFKEFLQALFISRQIYPIAYDKWIHEQIVEILRLPELYESLVRLFEIRHFESQEIDEKGKALKKLIAEHIMI